MSIDTGDDTTTWFPREDELTWREIDDEIVLLDLRSSQYLRLNSTGTTLWRRLGDGATVSELVVTLTEAFHLDPIVARHDVEAFVASCANTQLLRPSAR